jgi:catechol 2,3-dioxygenase-like lactoylglutathione lyase family enzyme
MSIERPASLQDVFVLVTTDRVAERKSFCARHFGFVPAFESAIYVQMSAPAEAQKAFSIAFMPPDHPFPNAGPETFDAKGLLLTIQVADARRVHDELHAAGAPILYALKDEAWGQRHFVTRDPAGVSIDVVQSIDGDPHYFDQYQARE